jgi:protein TonB
MLDNLVESKNNGRENKSLGSFLLTTFVLVVTMCFSVVLWSLFAKDLGMARENLDVSSLIAPIETAENTPPELMPKEKREPLSETKSIVPNRQTNMMSVEESQIAPEKVSVVPNTQKSRPAGLFTISDAPDSGEMSGSSSAHFNRGNGTGIELQNIEESSPVTESKKVEPPPAVKTSQVEATQKIKPLVKSGGVVNGQAKFLPKPIYSAAARAVKASGAVNVQVLIDEAGNVVSANAVDGNTLLRAEAEKAARNAKFKPTLLSGQPVKVSGVIVYKFSMQ